MTFSDKDIIQNRVGHHRGELVIDTFTLHIVRLLGWGEEDDERLPVFVYEHGFTWDKPNVVSRVLLKYGFISLKDKLSTQEYSSIEESFKGTAADADEIMAEIERMNMEIY